MTNIELAKGMAKKIKKILINKLKLSCKICKICNSSTNKAAAENFKEGYY